MCAALPCRDSQLMCDAHEALKLCQTPLQSSLLYTRGGLSTLARAVLSLLHTGSSVPIMSTTRADTKLLAQGTPEQWWQWW